MREVFCGVISQGVTPYFFATMKTDKICSFFGHRTLENTDRVYEAASAAIIKSLDFGCRTFYFGGYGEFDALCYKIVTRIKGEQPELDIKRIYCVPMERYLHKRVRYFRPEDYDGVIYLEPAFEGWYKSIYFRNCAMIDQSDVVIFYSDDREGSGAYKAYKYARGKRDKRILNIWNAVDDGFEADS